MRTGRVGGFTNKFYWRPRFIYASDERTACDRPTPSPLIGILTRCPSTGNFPVRALGRKTLGCKFLIPSMLSSLFLLTQNLERPSVSSPRGVSPEDWGGPHRGDLIEKLCQHPGGQMLTEGRGAPPAPSGTLCLAPQGCGVGVRTPANKPLGSQSVSGGPA